MKNTEYYVKLVESSKQLGVKERIALKNFSDMVQIDEATAENPEGIEINVDYYVEFDVHNEKSDNMDYKKYVYVDKNGVKYISGSKSLHREYISILEEMEGENVEWGIRVLRKPSSNYKGKDFLTCVII